MENNSKHYGRDNRRRWEDDNRDNSRRGFGSRRFSNNKPFRRSFDGERPRYNLEESGEQHPYRRFDDEKSDRRVFKPRRSFSDNRPRYNSEDGERRPYRRFDDERTDRREFKPHRSFDNERPRYNSEDGERRPYKRFDNERTDHRDFKPRRSFDDNQRRFGKSRYTKSYERPIEYTSVDKNLLSRNYDDEWNDEVVLEDYEMPKEEVFEEKQPATEAEGYRLNRFISGAGVCSRRAADDYIAAGRITLNGNVVTDFSTKVFPGDEVCLDGKRLSSQKRVYIVFNKPKDCISTKSDELGRRTIYDYVKSDVEVKNVGRLDRDTTGVMLLTNDGDLIERLTHPRYNKMKIYHVFLNKNLSIEDFRSISEGVELDAYQDEDGNEVKGGFIEIDDLQYVDGEKNQVGIQIHSGLYHVVRRIFEKYGYKVEKLDRVYFAGLTKKDLPRGRWRYLTQKEVAILKRGAYA